MEVYGLVVMGRSWYLGVAALIPERKYLMDKIGKPAAVMQMFMIMHSVLVLNRTLFGSHCTSTLYYYSGNK